MRNPKRDLGGLKYWRFARKTLSGTKICTVVWLTGSTVHSSDRFFWCDSWSLGYVQDILKYTVVLRYSTFSHLFQASSYATAVKSSRRNSEQLTCSFPPTIKREQSAQVTKKCSSETFKAKRKTTSKVPL